MNNNGLLLYQELKVRKLLEDKGYDMISCNYHIFHYLYYQSDFSFTSKSFEFIHINELYDQIHDLPINEYGVMRHRCKILESRNMAAIYEMLQPIFKKKGYRLDHVQDNGCVYEPAYKDSFISELLHMKWYNNYMKFIKDLDHLPIDEAGVRFLKLKTLCE